MGRALVVLLVVAVFGLYVFALNAVAHDPNPAPVAEYDDGHDHNWRTLAVQPNPVVSHVTEDGEWIVDMHNGRMVSCRYIGEHGESLQDEGDTCTNPILPASRCRVEVEL